MKNFCEIKKNWRNTYYEKDIKKLPKIIKMGFKNWKEKKNSVKLQIISIPLKNDDEKNISLGILKNGKN